MEDLKTMLAEKGVVVQSANCDESVLKNLAKAVGIRPPRSPVQVVEYTPKNSKEPARYVKTDNFTFTDKNGKERTSRGLFLRVEALEDAIADLVKARGLLD